MKRVKRILCCYFPGDLHSDVEELSSETKTKGGRRDHRGNSTLSPATTASLHPLTNHSGFTRNQVLKDNDEPTKGAPSHGQTPSASDDSKQRNVERAYEVFTILKEVSEASEFLGPLKIISGLVSEGLELKLASIRNKSGWSSLRSTLERHIAVFEQQRQLRDGGGQHNQELVRILDEYTSALTDVLAQVLREMGISESDVPPGMRSIFQSLQRKARNIGTATIVSDQITDLSYTLDTIFQQLSVSLGFHTAAEVHAIRFQLDQDDKEKVLSRASSLGDHLVKITGSIPVEDGLDLLLQAFPFMRSILVAAYHDENILKLQRILDGHQESLGLLFRRYTRADLAPDPESPLPQQLVEYTRELKVSVVSVLVIYGIAPAKVSVLSRAYTELGDLSSEELQDTEWTRLQKALECVSVFFFAYLEPVLSVDLVPKKQTLRRYSTRINDGKDVSPFGRQHERCLEGTRTGLLQEIDTWANSSSPPSRIYCLRDQAGTGKSTVAHTITSTWAKEGRLAASFFFSRGTARTSTGGDMCSYLALGLMERYPELRNGLERKLSSVTLRDQSVTAQWDAFVVKPLENLQCSMPNILVIDALDECDSTHEEILQSIISTFGPASTTASSFRIFFTTRPNLDSQTLNDQVAVINGLQQTTEQQRQTVADVHRYVLHQFSKMNDLCLTANEADKLAAHSGGLFIFASTACSMLKRSLDPVETLNFILSDGQFMKLDDLYRSIMARAIPDEPASRNVAQQVLSVILASQEIMPRGAVEALSPDPDAARRTLERLGSVISSEEQGGLVSIIHPTFREFLLHASRSKQFAINIHIGHRILARRSLQLLQNRQQGDICHVSQPNQPLPLRKNIDDLEERVIRYTSPELRYAASYGMAHTIVALHIPDIYKALREVFMTRLLAWIELISILDIIPAAMFGVKRQLEALKAISRLPNFVSESIDIERCADILHFLRSNQAILQASHLHVYTSALLFYPHDSHIYLQHHRYARLPLPILRASTEHASPGSLVLRGHTDEVTCVTYSPDGRRIASGSRDDVIQIWAADTGALVRTLHKCHRTTLALIFVPNTRYLLVASDNGTVSRWNLQLDKPTEEIWIRHSKPIISLLFCEHRREVICTSSDGELFRFQLETRGISWTLAMDGAGGTSSAALSTDGKYLARASSCGRPLCIWDMSNTTLPPVPYPVRFLGVNVDADDPVHIEFIPRSHILVMASKALRAWDVDTGALLWAHDIDAVIFSVLEDRETIVVVTESHPNALQLWNTRTKKTKCSFDGHTGAITCVESQKNEIGASFVSGSRDGTLRVWDAHNPLRDQDPAHDKQSIVTALALSYDGLTLLSTDEHDELRLWRAEGDGMTMVRMLHLCPPNGASLDYSTTVLHPLQPYIIIAIAEQSSLVAYNLRTSEFVRRIDLQADQQHLSSIHHIQFSPDGTLIVLTHPLSISIWHVEDILAVQPTFLHFDHNGEVEEAPGVSYFHPSGRYVVSPDRAWEIWPAAPYSTKATPSTTTTTTYENQMTTRVERLEGDSELLGRIRSETRPIRVRRDHEHQLEWIDIGNPIFQSLAIPTNFVVSAMTFAINKVALGSKDGRVVVLDASPVVKDSRSIHSPVQ